MSRDVPSSPLGERLHGLDALRAIALLLGVALHAAMAWMPGAQYFWITSDAENSLLASTLFWCVHVFRMTTFFLLAGFFARLLHARLGTRAFLGDRWRRVARPLLAGWMPIFTSIVMAIVWGAWLKGGGSLPADPPPGPAFTPDDFPLTHLWFLYVLLWLYAVTLVLRAMLVRVDRAGRVPAAMDALLSRVMHPWAALVLAVPVTVGLLVQSDWYAWFGVPTPDQSLYPNSAALLAYGTAFGIGWLLQRQRALLDRLGSQAFTHLALALVAIVTCLSIVGLAPHLAPAPQDASTVLYAFSYGVAGWATTLALAGFAMRWCRAPNAATRQVVDASFWVYLIHLPIVMALQVAAGLIAWPWWMEYPLVTFVGLALMFGSYRWLVQDTAFGRWLAGRRAPDKKSRIAATAERAGPV